MCRAGPAIEPGLAGVGDDVIENDGRIRLTSGMHLLERWSATADRFEKDAVYAALFAVLDGSVVRSYKIFDDIRRPRESFVLVREDLVVKICFTAADAFEIVYIGPASAAPGFDLGINTLG